MANNVVPISTPKTAHGFRFGLRSLVAMVLFAAWFAAMARHSVACAIVALLFLGGSWATKPSVGTQFVPFVASTLLIQVCLVSCLSVWYTDGEVTSVIPWIVFVPVALSSVLLFRAGAYGLAFIVSASLACPFISRQAFLMHRLWRVEREVAAIGTYAKQYKAANGSYPCDLSGYTFREERLREFVTYWDYPAGKYYVVSYKLSEGDNTAREFSPNGWWYYPD